jgi:hypothetical protein
LPEYRDYAEALRRVHPAVLLPGRASRLLASRLLLLDAPNRGRRRGRGSQVPDSGLTIRSRPAHRARTVTFEGSRDGAGYGVSGIEWALHGGRAGGHHGSDGHARLSWRGRRVPEPPDSGPGRCFRRRNRQRRSRGDGCGITARGRRFFAVGPGTACRLGLYRARDRQRVLLPGLHPKPRNFPMCHPPPERLVGFDRNPLCLKESYDPWRRPPRTGIALFGTNVRKLSNGGPSSQRKITVNCGING